MAKRLHEDGAVQSGAERSLKRIKKEAESSSQSGAERSFNRIKKEDESSSSKAKQNIIDKTGASSNGNTDSSDNSTKIIPTVNGDNKLSKEERRALKRARKEQDKLISARIVDLETLDTTSVQSSAAESERKALKRAEKAARKAEKAVHSNGSKAEIANGAVDTNGATSDARSKSLVVSDVSYREHAELEALPQIEIDAFISDKLLNVEDSQKQRYRPIVSFKYLPLGNEIDHSQFASFLSPTPVQAACWPYLFACRDVVGVAETGSGKTLAFGVPCIKYIAQLGKKERRSIKACIVSPTRELAMQIYEQIAKLAAPAGLKACCVYGGVNKDVQRETLTGAHIVVATPGRLNDFVQEGSIDLSKVSYLVLDEADRMLDKGFEEEVRRIINATPSTGRQTLMFTATWPQSVRDLAGTFMDKPVKITVGGNTTGDLRANAKIVQEVEVIEDREKQGRLIELLKQYQSGKNKKDRILVFCLYKKEATRIEEFIRRKGFPVAGIHGDLSQQKRTESLDAFKKGTVPLLVATDVAARGLDIPAVKLVINVTFPLTVEDYVHRIGRTGRAGQVGKAVTLFTTNEKGLAGGLINVLKAANQPVPEELLKFGTTVKKKGHDAYGAFYKDIGAGEMKKATKITFD